VSTTYPAGSWRRTATQSIQDRNNTVRHSSPAIEVFDSWRCRCSWVSDATPRRQVAWCHSQSSCNLRCPVSWNNTVADFYGKMWSSSGRGSFPIFICFVAYMDELINQLRHSSYSLHIELFVGCAFYADDNCFDVCLMLWNTKTY